MNSRRVRLRPDYVEHMQTGYAAEIDALDFSSPGAAARINGWASEATDGKISKVIDRVDPSGLAMLLDAVYFKGQWTHEFDPTHTQQRDFTLAPRIVNGRDEQQRAAAAIFDGTEERPVDYHLELHRSRHGGLKADPANQGWMSYNDGTIGGVAAAGPPAVALAVERILSWGRAQ